MIDTSKKGIITFHWAMNYGAVLQSYALQKFLLKEGYHTEIINYIPYRVRLLQILNMILYMRVREGCKEIRLHKFRKCELVLSQKKYFSNRSLINKIDDYDTILCGSDQIWNESFLQFAERKPTLSYYLNFAKTSTKRVAYAVSFGTEKLQQKCISLIEPEIRKFYSISVRENTGKKILDNIGVKSQIVIDPTFLLTKDIYRGLAEKAKRSSSEKVFAYILHENQATAIQVSNYIKKIYSEKANRKYYKPNCGLYEWLNSIQNSKCVVTNSYHGVALSIIFHIPFVVMPVEESNMNDRLYTLLNSLGLMQRIIYSYNEEQINCLLNGTIDWETVDTKLRILQQNAIKFLHNSLDGYCNTE